MSVIEIVDVLVGLTRRAAALAVDFHDEQLRMHLHQNAFAFDDLGTTHVRANLQALTDEVM